MLVGRERETARIDEVLDAARAGRSAALVLPGEAGIGKSALLGAAVERASDMRVLHARGVESEVDIAFSGLHELLRPVLPLVERLPDAQAVALNSALALGVQQVVDRLAVFGGALSLLAAAAEEQPLLCTIDDAHWLDDASAAALVFVARRLDADGIALLFAVREPEVRAFAAPGLPELRLHGLDRAAAAELLNTRLPAGVGAVVVEQLIELSNGNPLALIELPRGIGEAELATLEPLDEPLRVGVAVEREFLRRLGAVTATTRQALLVAAASDVGELRAIAGALKLLDLDPGALREAQTAGLVTLGSRVEFCHPLARSAIYSAADESERSEAHRALAAAAEAAGELDRRAWHLAAAAAVPDEAIAAALVEAAESARRRGGAWSEATALERAAQLTPDPTRRARRLLRAGIAARRAGRLERSDSLLQQAIETGLDTRDRAYAQERRAWLRHEQGQLAEALELMLAGAKEVEKEDSRAASRLLTNAATVVQHQLDIPAAEALAERAWKLAGDEAIDDAELCHIVSFQRVLNGRVADGMELAWRCARLVENDPLPGLVVPDAATTLLYAGEYGVARRLLEWAVRINRADGALGDLWYAVHNLAQLEWYSGNLQRGYAFALEAVQIAAEVVSAEGEDECGCRLATFEASLGRAHDSRGHAERALATTLRLGNRWNEAKARAALGLGALVTNDLDAAVLQLDNAVRALDDGGVGNPNQFRVHPDLVEAYVRLGRVDEAEPVVEALERHAERTEIPWTLAAARRCRGIVTADVAEATTMFLDALELDDGASAFERARTELCFGEHLRRHGLRRDARARLASALETFEHAGAVPWAERARAELQASGMTLRRRGPAAQEQLTPQELQIAQLVAEGRTNRDVAATLFLSQKTVEFHLTNIYRKLDIHSRSELVRRFAREAAEVEGEPSSPALRRSVLGRR
jgi:DNA-binding CsgD family transcriptional regulator/Tfp pilus assembly protein PilF